MVPVARVPSRNRTESPESFQPWLARPRPLVSRYSRKPSPSGSPGPLTQAIARSRCASSGSTEKRHEPGGAGGEELMPGQVDGFQSQRVGVGEGAIDKPGECGVLACDRECLPWNGIRRGHHDVMLSFGDEVPGQVG